MKLLEKILIKRQAQLEREKNQTSLNEMKKQAIFSLSSSRRSSFKDELKKPGVSVIAEIKKASPSKGVIQEVFHPIDFANKYQAGGATAISCLTEEYYFQGNNEYLKAISQVVKIPILRKDFIFDEYQIYEAKTLGADAILLIAGMLSQETMKNFYQLTKELEMDSLIEIHNEEELEKAIKINAEIIGINNRNLKTFEVNLETTFRLASLLPAEIVKISESGINSVEDIYRLKNNQIDGVLIGEALMKSTEVEKLLRKIVGAGR